MTAAGRSPQLQDRERGFTLIEVLVAFTIAAIVLVALLEGVHRGLDGIRAAERRTSLLAAAENRMAEVGRLIPLAPGVYEGEDGAVAWQVRVAPAATAQATEAGEPAARGLLHVAVRVRGAAGGELRLDSLRLDRSRP